MHRPPRTAAPAAPEKIHYNFSDYPVYIRRDHLSQYPNYSGTAHWHEDPEFILILSGHMVYNVNGRRIHLTEGSGILVNSCQFHHGFSADGSDCEFICIIVSPLLLSANEYFERTYIAPILKNEDFPWLLLSPETDWQQGMLDCLRDIFRESREQGKKSLSGNPAAAAPPVGAALPPHGAGRARNSSRQPPPDRSQTDDRLHSQALPQENKTG